MLASMIGSAQIGLVSAETPKPTGTTAKIWTDKTDYHPGTTVTIFGSSFLPNATIALSCTKLKDGSITKWTAIADQQGNFTTTYQIDKQGAPLYNVIAKDGTNKASTTFTDSSALDGSTTATTTTGRTLSLSLTTTNANDLLYVSVTTGVPVYVSSVSGGSLTWTCRQSAGNTLGFPSTTATHYFSTWYAVWSSSGTIAITVTLSAAATAGASAEAFGVSGVNTASPFDGASVSAVSSATGTSASVTKSTSNPNDFIIGAIGVDSAPSGGTAGTGFTVITTASTTGGSSKTFVADEYDLVSSIQAGLAVSFSCSSGKNWAVVGDELNVAVSQPITVTMSNSAPSATVTINGGNPSPSTFAADGSQHTITMDAGASFTLSFSNAGTVRDGFIVASAFSATSTSYTASTTAVSATAYLQVQNTFSESGLTSSSGSIGLTGTYLGTAGSTIVTLSSSTSSASAWSDYNVAVTFPASSSLSGSSERWSMGSASATAALTAGGNTYSQAYVHQYKVTFYKSGVGTDFTGTVLTVDSIGYTVAGFPSPFWWNAGSSHTFSFASPLVVGSSVSYTWVYTTGGLSTQQSETLTINASGIIDGNYFTTGSVSFIVTGVQADFMGTVVTIDGTPYTLSTLPSSFVWSLYSMHTFTFQSPLVVTSNGKQYVWTHNEGLSALQSDSINITSFGPLEGYFNTQYYLSVNDGGHGTVGGAGWYNAGVTAHATMTPLTVAGAANTQYVFAGWTGDASGSGSPSNDIVMGAAKTATASWTTQYQVTFAVSPSGTGSTSPAGTNVWENAGSLSISATASTGYSFLSWSSTAGTVANAGLASTSVTISEAGTITANFVQVLDHFVFNTVGSQVAGSSFSLTVTAVDAYGNTVTSYIGTPTLSDISGSITPIITGVFVGGVWTGSVTVTKAGSDVVTATDGGISGVSNSFTVAHAVAVAGVALSPVGSSVTAGLTVTYSATASDSYGNSWDVTSSTVFSIDVGAGGSWLSNVYTSEKAGLWTVTGTYASVPYTTTLTVTVAPSTTTTLLSKDSIVLGGSVTDKITISTSASGTLPSASGTWTLYVANNAAMTGKKMVGSGSVSGALPFLVTSSAYTPSSAGTYYFQAIYSGGNNYAGSTSTIESLTVTQAPTPTPTPTLTPTPTPPVFVVPESPLGALAALGAGIAALLVYTALMVYKRKSRPSPPNTQKN